VSVVPPAYYADLAAQRGLLLSLRGAGAGGLDDLASPSDAAGDSSSNGVAPGDAGAAAAGGDGGGDCGAAGAPFDVRVHPRLGGTMHYL
jgi:hypothetical protein